MRAKEGERGPVRVLFLLTTLDVGGSECSALRLLQRLDRRSVQPMVVSLLSGGRLLPAFQELGLPLFQLGVGPGLRELCGARLFPLLWKHRPEVIHSMLFLSNQWARLARLGAVRVLSEEQGVEDDRPAWATWMNRLTAPLTTLHLANAEAVARRMSARDRIAADRIRVVRGGIDLSAFNPRPVDLIPEYDFVCVARLERIKGIYELLTAMQELVRTHPTARLCLVGDGSERAAVEQQIAARGLSGAVGLLGARADVQAWLHRSRVFVLPSHQEGFSTAVLEAMACGLPTVATRVGGTPEQVLEGRTGRLVPPGDPPALAAAMRAYLDRPVEIETHGRAARHEVARFSLDTLVGTLERLYHSVARGTPA